MPTLDELARQLADLRRELRQTAADGRTGDLLLARAIRRGRVQATIAEHEDSWRRLSPDVGLQRWVPRSGKAPQQPDLSGSLLARLRAGDPVADSLGNTAPAGYANLLANPTMDANLGTWVTLTTTPSEFTSQWSAYRTTGTGTPPVCRASTLYAAGQSTHNFFNSARALIELGQAAVASAFSVYVESEGFQPQYDSDLPYLAGAFRLSRWAEVNHGNCTQMDATVELVRRYGSGGSDTVLEVSPTIDMLQYGGDWTDFRLGAVFLKDAPWNATSGGFASIYRLRLRIDATFSAATSYVQSLSFGEPVLTLSSSQSVPAYAPTFGAWLPHSLYAAQLGDTYYRTSVDTLGLYLGSGSANANIRIKRDGSGNLVFDLTSGNVVMTTPLKLLGAGGSGEELWVGDDAIIYDVDVADAIGIKGQSNASNGKIVFGAGLDTNLYRGAANQVNTDDALVVGGDVTLGSQGIALGGSVARVLSVTDGGSSVTGKLRGLLLSDAYADGTPLAGVIQFGADTNLYRSAANVLATDDRFDADPVGRAIRKTTATSTTTSTWTKITGWTNTDMAGLHTTYNVYSGGEIRVEAAGWYLITGSFDFASMTATRVIAGFSFADSATPSATPSATDENTFAGPSGFAFHQTIVAMKYLPVNKTVALCVHQNSGGSVNVDSAKLSLVRLAAPVTVSGVFA